MSELYVLAYVNDNYDIVGFPKGGGSSTKPSVKAHDNLASAKRSQRFFPKSVIVKMTEFEIVGDSL